MKTTILTSVFAVLVSVANLSARNVTTYSNVEVTSSGTNKEYVSIDNETSKPVTKELYDYGIDGKLEVKKISKWDDSKGWVNSSKYEYQYNEVGKVSNVIYTKWNEKTNSWSDKSEFLVHIYNENDEILSIKQIQIENNIDNTLLTQK